MRNLELEMWNEVKRSWDPEMLKAIGRWPV